jgi:hypothetical protein
VECNAGCCSVYGNPTSFGGTGTYTAVSACVRPVTVAAGGTLVDFGIIGITPGVQTVMGLYTDSGGAPGTLVVQTAEAALVDGPLLIPVTATPISAGSYWIAAEFDGTAEVDESPSTTVTAYCDTTPFSATLPATFGASLPYTGRLANWYVLVQ